MKNIYAVWTWEQDQWLKEFVEAQRRRDPAQPLQRIYREAALALGRSDRAVDARVDLLQIGRAHV